MSTNLQEIETLGKSGVANQILTTSATGTEYEWQSIEPLIPTNLQEINTLGKGTSN